MHLKSTSFHDTGCMTTEYQDCPGFTVFTVFLTLIITITKFLKLIGYRSTVLISTLIGQSEPK